MGDVCSTLYSPVFVADSLSSEERMSYDSAGYNADELNHVSAADDDKVAHSELWKWVDAPVFVPKKSTEKLKEDQSNSNSGDFASCCACTLPCCALICK